MKSLIKVLPIIAITFIANLTMASEYKVINRDFILGSHQIEIEFSPSLVKEEISISYQPCPNCEWKKASSNDETEFYFRTLPVEFKKFKERVKQYKYNPPKHKYKAFISIDSRNNNIFTIKWDYVEL